MCVRWSHHCNVQTCDDDALKNAVGDDGTVSFVFGLEVNWCLLKSSEEEKREEREQRKAQAQRDLEELNESRRKKKRDLSSTDTVDDAEAADCTKEQLRSNPDKEKENKINNSDGGKSKKKLKSEAGPHDSSQEVRRKDLEASSREQEETIN
jgi:hypothetical protein